MTLSPPQIARPALPEGVAHEYAGRWIAVRGATVIADAETLGELTDDSRVRDDDTVFHVPPTNSAFF
jgi:hypothetical protein